MYGLRRVCETPVPEGRHIAFRALTQTLKAVLFKGLSFSQPV
jgi:hypothetical protein